MIYILLQLPQKIPYTFKKLQSQNITESKMSTQQVESIQQSQVAGFISKTFQMLNNQNYSKVISWSLSGKQFAIKDINKFQQIVLPKYFRHKKINSFIRQLNMYGFHKSRKDCSKSIFSHPNFIKDRDDLLHTIKRKIRTTEGIIKIPKKQKDPNNKQQKKDPQTAIKQQQSLKKIPLQSSQLIQKMLSQSKQLFNSKLSLSVSLKKLSMSSLVYEQLSNPQSDKDQNISIEFQIQKKDQDFIQHPTILNPSLFFNSFKESSTIK